MKMSRLFIGGALAIASAAAGAQGNVTLNPGTVNVLPGQEFSLNVNFDFTGDVTQGGAFDVFFDDTKLNYVKFDFTTSTIGDDVAFRSSPVYTVGQLDGVNVGHFSGISGPGVLGTVTFAADPGATTGSTLITMANNDTVWGSFINLSGVEQTVNYGMATVNVVPEMETWAMMAAGIGFMSWKLRRRQGVRDASL